MLLANSLLLYFFVSAVALCLLAQYESYRMPVPRIVAASVSVSRTQLSAAAESTSAATTAAAAAAATTDKAVMSFIKKGKLKYVKALQAEVETQGEEHPINKYLKTGELPYNVIKPVDFYYQMKANVQGFGRISVMPEYNKKVKTGFMAGMPPPEILGGILRDAGSKAIVVSMDNRSGGTSVDEFERFCRDQAKARLFIPPPIPVIWNDHVLDKLQVAQAAATGASAIILNPSICDEALAALVAYAFELQIEPVVLAASPEEAAAALAAGARCLCLHSLGDDELVECKKAVVAATDGAEGLCFFARIRPEEDFPIYHEIDLSWHLRDNGFAGVWPSPEAVYGTGMPDIYQNIAAMSAKASRIFLSPRQFMMDRKKEGATEYLGNIEI